MILGKSNQTLLGHVTDCLTAMNARISLDEPVLKTVCTERLQVDWPEVLACLRYAAVMHDIGKATDVWQKQEAERIRTKSDHSLITHAIPSAFITANALQLSRTIVDTPKHAATLAIWGHHGQLHSQSAQSGKLTPLGLLQEGWQELSNLAQQSSGFTLRSFPTADSRSFFTLSDMEAKLCVWKDKLPESRDARLRFKALYCLMASLLRTCDTVASKFAGDIPETQASETNPGGAFLQDPGQTPFLHDWHKVIDTDVLNGRFPYRLQQRANELNNLCDLLNAGCGEGKTAFALRHAQSLMQQGKINRIIFTLPTKFTSNNMHKDFRKEYQLPEDLVGIFHSDSLAFLKQQIDNEEEKNNIGELQQQDKVYHRPITISTVDHLLMCFYHGYKYSDWAFGNILQSLIVFDELHHYETLTVSAINEVLAVLRLLRIPHLIMTATIPTTRISSLNSRLPGDLPSVYNPLRSDGKEEKPEYDNQELRIKEAFIFVKREERMVWAIQDNERIRYVVAQSLLDDLVKHQHLRQIVFVNQVEKAKAIARVISANKDIAPCCRICYHAEFIGKHRNEKELEIRQAFAREHSTPCILIATQIAELSLDISADRMYSEIAPLDDIAQRGGRLHRNGISCVMNNGQHYEMLVYKLDFEDKSDVLPYVKLNEHKAQSPDVPHLLERSWEILPDNAVYRFDNICEWVNALYDKIITISHDNLRQAVLDDAVFGSKPQERYSEDGEDDSGQVILRAKEYETFDVVPQMFVGELIGSSEVNRDYLVKINEFKFWKASTENLIEPVFKSIKVYRRRSDQSEYLERKYLILKRPYTYEFGVDFTGNLDFPTDDQPIKIAWNIIS